MASSAEISTSDCFTFRIIDRSMALFENNSLAINACNFPSDKALVVGDKTFKSGDICILEIDDEKNETFQSLIDNESLRFNLVNTDMEQITSKRLWHTKMPEGVSVLNFKSLYFTILIKQDWPDTEFYSYLQEDLSKMKKTQPYDISKLLKTLRQQFLIIKRRDVRNAKVTKTRVVLFYFRSIYSPSIYKLYIVSNQGFHVRYFYMCKGAPVYLLIDINMNITQIRSIPFYNKVSSLFDLSRDALFHHMVKANNNEVTIDHIYQLPLAELMIDILQEKAETENIIEEEYYA